MVREILKFPDPRLRKKGVAITSVTPELKKLAEDMIETMYDENGIGLAAPQLGDGVRQGRGQLVQAAFDGDLAAAAR